MDEKKENDNSEAPIVRLLETQRKQHLEDLKEVLETKGRSDLPWASLSFSAKKNRLSHFATHIVFSTIMPFFPICVAFLLGYEVGPESKILTISIYLVAVAVSSSELGFFIVGFIAALFFMVVYGDIASTPKDEIRSLEIVMWCAWGAAAVMTVSNLINGYYDHLKRDDAALRFMRND